jgi:hypothetical protein
LSARRTTSARARVRSLDARPAPPTGPSAHRRPGPATGSRGPATGARSGRARSGRALSRRAIHRRGPPPAAAATRAAAAPAAAAAAALAEARYFRHPDQ